MFLLKKDRCFVTDSLHLVRNVELLSNLDVFVRLGTDCLVNSTEKDASNLFS